MAVGEKTAARAWRSSWDDMTEELKDTRRIMRILTIGIHDNNITI